MPITKLKHKMATWLEDRGRRSLDLDNQINGGSVELGCVGMVTDTVVLNDIVQ